jgi:prefoldin subunit 5
MPAGTNIERAINNLKDSVNNLNTSLQNFNTSVDSISKKIKWSEWILAFFTAVMAIAIIVQVWLMYP